MSKSMNGWEALASDSPLLYTWSIPGVRRTRLRLRNGSAGFLQTHLACRFDRNVEDIDNNYNNGMLDDWAYAFRPVRGYSTGLSNHSSGTAIDLNATEHPLGREGTFTAQQERRIRRMLAVKYDGAIRWGGDYQGRKDEMHFEIDCNLAYAEQIARELLDTPVGKEILKLNPGQKAVILS